LNYRGQWKPTILSSGINEMSSRYAIGIATMTTASQAVFLNFMPLVVGYFEF
jgi:hypothetical protein